MAMNKENMLLRSILNQGFKVTFLTMAFLNTDQDRFRFQKHLILTVLLMVRPRIYTYRRTVLNIVQMPDYQ